jgi:hypothetical protein
VTLTVYHRWRSHECGTRDEIIAQSEYENNETPHQIRADD